MTIRRGLQIVLPGNKFTKTPKNSHHESVVEGNYLAAKSLVLLPHTLSGQVITQFIVERPEHKTTHFRPR